MSTPVVFISYAHKDDPRRVWIELLKTHLSALQVQDKLVVWNDLEIQPGDDWHQTIQSNLQNARVAVLLIGPAFLGSEYIRRSELPVLLMNARVKGTKVLPVLLRPCLFDKVTFNYPDPVNGPNSLLLSSLQAGAPLSRELNGLKKHEQDRVLRDLAASILKIIQSSPTAEPAPSLPAASPDFPPAGSGALVPPEFVQSLPAPSPGLLSTLRQRFVALPRRKQLSVLIGGTLALILLGVCAVFIKPYIFPATPKLYMRPFSDAFDRATLTPDGFLHPAIWDYPRESWQVVAGKDGDEEDRALLIKGNGRAILKDKLFADFDAEFTVQFKEGTKAAWTLRAQPDSQGGYNGYNFILEKPVYPGDPFQLVAYVHHEGDLGLPKRVGITQYDPNLNDSLLVRVAARGNKFFYRFRILGPGNRENVKSPICVTIEDEHQRIAHGQVGLLGVDGAGKIQVEHFSITPKPATANQEPDVECRP